MTRYEVARTDGIEAARPTMIRVNGLDLGVFRVGDEYRAYRNVCPHAGAPICHGPVTGTILRCPWHGWKFDLQTGKHLFNPDCQLESHAVEVEGDRLFVWA